MNRFLHAMSIAVFVLAICAHALQGGPSPRAVGAPSTLGNGTVASYAEFDASGVPKAIGVFFSAGALDNLPTAHSDRHHCFDANKDGVLDLDTECLGSHERVLPLPSEASRRPDLPFKWALLDWNTHGHIPPGIYDTYESRVTFYEEMVTLQYLRSQPDACVPIKTATAAAATGYYPTRSCIRFAKNGAEYTVSIEGFVLREGRATGS